jgi:hypothetical protein
MVPPDLRNSRFHDKVIQMRYGKVSDVLTTAEEIKKMARIHE